MRAAKQMPLLFSSCCRGARHIDGMFYMSAGYLFHMFIWKTAHMQPPKKCFAMGEHLKKYLEDDWEYLILSHSQRTNQICVLWTAEFD